MRFADEAPKPERGGVSPVVIHKSVAKVVSQFPVQCSFYTTPAFPTYSPNPLVALACGPALLHLELWSGLAGQRHLPRGPWLGWYSGCLAVCCLPLCFGACGREPALHRGSQGFTRFSAAASSKGLSIPELPRPKDTGLLPQHPSGPGKLLWELNTSLGPESLGPREGQGQVI